MSFWTRRKFIFVGVTGVVAAGVVSLLPKLSNGAEVRGAALVTEHAKPLELLTIALLGPALPTENVARTQAIGRVTQAIAKLIDNLPATTRKEIADLFVLLVHKPARTLLGFSGDWHESQLPNIADFLIALRNSSIGMKQQAYFALHDLVFGSFYADPQSWKRSGYPGPPTFA